MPTLNRMAASADSNAPDVILRFMFQMSFLCVVGCLANLSLWPTINSDKSATERSELSWFTGLRVDLPLPATPPSWSAFPLPDGPNVHETQAHSQCSTCVLRLSAHH